MRLGFYRKLPRGFPAPRSRKARIRKKVFFRRLRTFSIERASSFYLIQTYGGLANFIRPDNIFFKRHYKAEGNMVGARITEPIIYDEFGEWPPKGQAGELDH